MSSATTDPSSSASSRNSPCAICCLHPSKYTCPRCSVRTCSLACFNAHKKGSPSSINGTSDGGCSGERNKVAYVPPNKYGYGQMMDDYAFLEETRRKVEGWGTSSAVGGAAGASGPASTAGPQGKGKKAQHPQQQGGGAGAQARNDVLAREVQARLGGARVVFLPEGMQRRRLNQSGWNLKTRTMHLSIEVSFPCLPPPAAPSISSSSSRSSPVVPSILLPRVAVVASGGALSSTTLEDLLKTQVLKHPKRPKGLEGWLVAQGQDAEEARGRVVFAARLVRAPGLPDVASDAIAAPSSRAGPTPVATRGIYHPAHPETSTLVSLLRGLGFVEYPTIELWAQSEWKRAVEAGEVSVVGKCDEHGMAIKSSVGVRSEASEKSEAIEQQASVDTTPKELTEADHSFAAGQADGPAQEQQEQDTSSARLHAEDGANAAMPVSKATHEAHPSHRRASTPQAQEGDERADLKRTADATGSGYPVSRIDKNEGEASNTERSSSVDDGTGEERSAKRMRVETETGAQEPVSLDLAPGAAGATEPAL